MSLRRIFAELYASAATTGEARRELEGGAAIAVTIRGGRRQVVISRPAVPVSTVETTTFCAHGDIPDDAVGVCWFWNKRHGYRVSFTWEPAAPPATLFAPAAFLHPIFTAGYGGGWAPGTLATEVARVEAELWDIRYQPWSRSPHWRGDALAELLGERYVYVKALGNVNYKGGPITLCNPPAAVERARAALSRRPIVLLCGCAEAEACHRSIAADYLAEQLGGVPVIHLEPPPPPTVTRGHVWQLLAEGEPLPGGL